MRRSLLLALALVPFVVSEVTGAPPPAPHQFQPTQTLQDLKTAFARGDKAEEWRTLSPGFKARLSKQAGRHVDVADYIHARNAYRNDPRVKELQQWIHTASMTRFHKFGNGKARATIRFGAAILVGKDVQVTMINHGMWRLTVRGDQPYWGFMGDKRSEAIPHRDGSYTVVTRDMQGKVIFQKQIPANQVVNYFRFNKWFFDGFGNMEQEFMRGVGVGGGRRAAAAPPPRSNNTLPPPPRAPGR